MPIGLGITPLLLAVANLGTADAAPATGPMAPPPQAEVQPQGKQSSCTALPNPLECSRPSDAASLAPPSAPNAAAPDAGPIVVTARKKDPADPAEAVNLKSFEAVTAVDKAVVGPIAKAYEHGVPSPARSGLRNFLRNLTEPINFANFLLQAKPGKAFETMGRFAINSTVGIGGLVDVARAKPINLPYRANGFANTLGFYGIGPGPYMFLPVIGPTTARDLFGWVIDKSFLPTLAGAPFNRPVFAMSTGVIKAVDDRVELNGEITAFRASTDPYVAEREWYLAKRRDEIAALHGRGPLAARKAGAVPGR